MTSTWAVVVNYRTPEDTILAVRSLLASDPPPARIIVVDNGSGDGSPGLIRRQVPCVTVIEASRNEGFSEGCNIGIRASLEAGADRVFLVNSDVLVRPDTLRVLGGELDADTSIGIVGPAIMSRRRPDEIQSLGMSYSHGTGRMRHAGCGRRWPPAHHSPTRHADGVMGCAMLIKREVFDVAGLFAEEYFFGFEDLELCLRAGGHGLRSVCVGATRVLHEGSRSIGPMAEARAYFAARNHLLLASRFPEGGRAVPRAFRSLVVVGLNVAHSAFSGDVPPARALRGCLRGVRDHLRGRYGNA
jgi:GT2 family glycosyltransferase